MSRFTKNLLFASAGVLVPVSIFAFYRGEYAHGLTMIPVAISALWLAVQS